MLTLDDLRQVLEECAGENEALHTDGDDGFSDVEFAELGYDSLALMETSAALKKRYGIDIPEDRLPELETPRALVDYANNPSSAG